MNARIHITVETEVGQHVEEIACWDRDQHRLEDIGLTLAEAMHAGIPVLTTRVGAIPEFVDESNGVLVSPGSPLEMSLALRDFLAMIHGWLRRAFEFRDKSWLDDVVLQVSGRVNLDIEETVS